VRFLVEVKTVDGSLPGSLGASCFPRVFSAPAVSVSVSAVQSGWKNLRVNIAFGGSLKAVDARTGLVDFMAVCEVLGIVVLQKLHDIQISTKLAFVSSISGIPVMGRTPSWLHSSLPLVLMFRTAVRLCTAGRQTSSAPSSPNGSWP
jgi:hypothetical protein